VFSARKIGYPLRAAAIYSCKGLPIGRAQGYCFGIACERNILARLFSVAKITHANQILRLYSAAVGFCDNMATLISVTITAHNATGMARHHERAGFGGDFGFAGLDHGGVSFASTLRRYSIPPCHARGENIFFSPTFEIRESSFREFLATNQRPWNPWRAMRWQALES
jgi:hypothetical protein